MDLNVLLGTPIRAVQRPKELVPDRLPRVPRVTLERFNALPMEFDIRDVYRAFNLTKTAAWEQIKRFEKRGLCTREGKVKQMPQGWFIFRYRKVSDKPVPIPPRVVRKYDGQRVFATEAKRRKLLSQLPETFTTAAAAEAWGITPKAAKDRLNKWRKAGIAVRMTGYDQDERIKRVVSKWEKL